MMQSWLLDRGPSAWRYVLRLGLTSLIPSTAIAIVTFAILSPLGLPVNDMAPKFGGSSRLVTFVEVVVLSPAVETMLMAAGIAILSRFTLRPFAIAAASALLWAVLHSSAFLIWGIVIAWPFFVFSCAYLAWRPLGVWRAVAVAACIHMFQNLLPGILLFLA